MYKINLAAMIVLSIAVAGGAAFLALRKTAPDASQKERVDYLVRCLGDGSPDVRRQAEADLRKMGPAAAEALRAASQSGDPRVADRAKGILKEFEGRSDSVAVQDPKGKPRKNPLAGVEPAAARGVSVELLSSQEQIRGETPRFYVRMTNHDSIPYLVARVRVAGQALYSRFARFEIVDSQGRISTVPADAGSGLAAAEPDLLVLGPGETLDLFAGQGDSMTSLPASLEPDEYRIRFLYDAASESAYRHVVQGVATASPLPPQLLASAPVTVRIVD